MPEQLNTARRGEAGGIPALSRNCESEREEAQ